MPAKRPPKKGASIESGPEIRLLPWERTPGRMLYRAHVAMRSGLLGILRDSGFDLSVEEWVILSSLWDYGEMAQPELGDRVAKDRHFVSRLLDSLEQKKLVQRKGIEGDRRIKRVQLTPKGQAAQALLLAAFTRYLDQVFTGISRAQYEAFMQCLDTIVAWHAGQRAQQGEGPLPILPLCDK